MSQGRSLLKQIFANFLNSLKPKNYWGVLRGKDYLGTEYYESPEGLQYHRRPQRWFVPSVPDNFEQEIPPEWEAWLRHRRREPPTEEEISFNIQKMLKTIANAKNLEKPKTVSSDEIKIPKKHELPIYKEYELEHRINQNKKNDQ